MDIQKLRLIIDSSAAKDGADKFTAATTQVAGGAVAATEKITKMESALDSTARQSRTTAEAIQKQTISTEQGRQAWERSGGSMENFVRELQRIADGEKQVTDSTRKMTLTQMEAITMNDKLGQTFNTSGAGLGRLRMGVTSLAASLTGTNPLLDRTVATLGSMAAGTTMVLAALGGVVAAGIIWNAYTEQGRKAVAEQDKMTKSLEAWYEKEREGAAGAFPKEIAAETEKIKDLRKELDSFGKLGAVGEGGSKGLAWVRMWTEAAGFLASGAGGSLDSMKIFWKKMQDEVHDGAAHALAESQTGFAAIHAATVKYHNDIQRSQADALANLIASNHATAAERAKAQDALKADILELARLDRLAQSTSGGTKVDQAQRIALAEEIKKLTEALNPPKLQAAKDKLSGISDEIARMHTEAANFGKDNGINNRVATIVDALSEMEKKYPSLTAEIEKYKASVKAAGTELINATDAYKRQKAEEETATHVAERIEKLRMETELLTRLNEVRGLGAEASDKVKIQVAAENAVREAQNDAIARHTSLTLMDIVAIEAAAAAHEKAVLESQKEKTVDNSELQRQKQLLHQMQTETAKFFDDLFTKGVHTFGDLFGTLRSMFFKLLTDMMAADIFKRFGSQIMHELIVLQSQPGGGLLRGGTMGNGPGAGTTGLAYGGTALAGLGVGFTVGQSANNYGLSALGGAASGAAMGAMIGSVVPVLGTAVGAVVGGVAGLVGGLLGHSQKLKDEAKALKTARDDFFKSLDSFVFGLSEHSALEKSLHDLSASMVDLRKHAADLKLTHGELADAEAAATKAESRMKQDFLDSIDQQIAAANGQDYMSQALAFQKTYQQNLKDIATAGGDVNKASTLFVAQLTQMAASMDAPGIEALMHAFPELSKGLDPAAAKQLADTLANDLVKALAAVAKQAALAADTLLRASEDLQVRFGRASGSGSADQMARNFANREEIFQAEQGGASPDYVAQLKVVQLYENAQAVVQKRIADLSKIAQDQLSVQSQTLSVAQSNLNATQQVVDTLTNYRQSLQIGTLSPLSPVQQIAEAKSQLVDAFTKGMAGDKNAAGSVPQLSTTYLEQLRSGYASTSTYTSGYADVQDMLKKLSDKYADQLTADQLAQNAAQKQVDLLSAQLTQLQDVSYQAEQVKIEVVAEIQSQVDAADKAASAQLAQLQQMQAVNEAQLAINNDLLATAVQAYQQALINGDANASDLYDNMMAVNAVHDKLEEQKKLIADQIKAVQDAKVAADATGANFIQAIKDGATLADLGKDQLVAAIQAQALADQLRQVDSIKALKDQTDRLIGALKDYLDPNAGGVGHVWLSIGDALKGLTGGDLRGGGIGLGGIGGSSASPLVVDNTDVVAKLKDVVTVLTTMRDDARATGTALNDRLQALGDTSKEHVQLVLFEQRDNPA